MSIESFNGVGLHLKGFPSLTPANCANACPCAHGQALHWIAAGGSFASSSVMGQVPQTSTAFVMDNLYVQGMSWGESVYAATGVVGGLQTPIGDPLATVRVIDVDVNCDGIVDQQDLDIFDGIVPIPPLCGATLDFDGNGAIDAADRFYLEEIFALDPNGRNCSAYPQPPTPTIPWPPVAGGTSPPPVQWRGDIFPHDGFVNEQDLQQISDKLNKNLCNALLWDIDSNGAVDTDDLLDVLRNWGRLLGDVPGITPCQVDLQDLAAVTVPNPPIDCLILCPGGCVAGCPDVAGPPYPIVPGTFQPDEVNEEAHTPVPHPDGWVDGWDVLAVQMTGCHSTACAPCGQLPDLVTLNVQYGLNEHFNGTEFAVDCDLSTVYDIMEIAAGTVQDCDGNGVPDSCDISAGTAFDCNGNGIPDSCDIASGFSQDVDDNGIPDECFAPCFCDFAPVNPSAPDGNGVVNIDDLVLLLSHFGESPPIIGTDGDCNVNPDNSVGNGVVNIDDLVALLSEFGITCGSAQSTATNATGLQITSVSFDLGFPDASGIIDANSSSLVSAAWAADQNGSNPVDVFRLWATLVGPSNTITFVGGGTASGVGGAAEPLVLSPGKNATFYVPDGDYSNGVNVGLLAIDGGPGLENFQNQAFKTFIALGSAMGSGPTKFGDPAGLDAILTGAVNDPNTGWGVVGPAPGQGVVSDGNGGWRILIGQFAVPQGKTFTAAVRLVGDGVDTYATITSASAISSP